MDVLILGVRLIRIERRRNLPTSHKMLLGRRRNGCRTRRLHGQVTGRWPRDVDRGLAGGPRICAEIFAPATGTLVVGAAYPEFMTRREALKKAAPASCSQIERAGAAAKDEMTYNELARQIAKLHNRQKAMPVSFDVAPFVDNPTPVITHPTDLVVGPDGRPYLGRRPSLPVTDKPFDVASDS